MDISFHGKRALVTGAGKGIGRALVKALAAGGADTVAVSRTQADLDSLKAEVPTIHTIQVDLTDWKATQEAISAICPVDLLVNNAAIGRSRPLEDIEPNTFQDLLDINLKAVVNVSQLVAKTMVDRGKGGAIVNVSSQASQMALWGHIEYAASKAAVDSITRVMALELGPHQIRVNAINPTVIMTEMSKKYWSVPERRDPMLAKIPMGKFGEVKDVVHPILYLLSDKADMITGITLPVDGGCLAC